MTAKSSRSKLRSMIGVSAAVATSALPSSTCARQRAPLTQSSTRTSSPSAAKWPSRWATNHGSDIGFSATATRSGAAAPGIGIARAAAAASIAFCNASRRRERREGFKDGPGWPRGGAPRCHRQRNRPLEPETVAECRRCSGDAQ